MKYCGNSLYVLGVHLSLIICALAAQPVFAEPALMAWEGSVQEDVLPDESTLVEFIASTSSKSAEGAILSISFIPRFNCSPLISVRVPSRQVSATGSVLTLQIDGEQKTYPVIADTDDGEVIYTIDGSLRERAVLRKLLDLSLQVNAWVVRPPSKPEDVRVNTEVKQYADSLADFSLLGSRRAAFSAEARCKSHQVAAPN